MRLRRGIRFTKRFAQPIQKQIGEKQNMTYTTEERNIVSYRHQHDQEKYNPYKQSMDIAYDERKKLYKKMEDKYGKGVEWDDLSKNEQTMMRCVMDAYKQHCRFHHEYEQTGKMQ